MPISPRLSRSLHQSLGDEAAEDLMNWMEELDGQRASVGRFEARLDATRGDIADLRQETHALRQEMHAGFAQLREEMHVGLARMEAMLERRTADLMKWSFVFWVGAVAAVAMLADVLP